MQPPDSLPHLSKPHRGPPASEVPLPGCVPDVLEEVGGKAP